MSAYNTGVEGELPKCQILGIVWTSPGTALWHSLAFYHWLLREKMGTSLSASHSQKVTDRSEASDPTFLPTREAKWPQLLLITYAFLLNSSQDKATPTLNILGGSSLDQLAILFLMQPKMQLTLLAAGAHCWFMLSLLSQAPTGPFLLSCSPATHLLFCTYIQHYSILGAEPSINSSWTSCTDDCLVFLIT